MKSYIPYDYLIAVLMLGMLFQMVHTVPQVPCITDANCIPSYPNSFCNSNSFCQCTTAYVGPTCSDLTIQYTQSPTLYSLTVNTPTLFSFDTKTMTYIQLSFTLQNNDASDNTFNIIFEADEGLTPMTLLDSQTRVSIPAGQSQQF